MNPPRHPRHNPTLFHRSTANHTCRRALVLLACVGFPHSRVSADALGDALESPGWAWTTGGSANWSPQTTIAQDSSDAARSGAIGNSSESWIQTSVTGPGTLSWWWKVSSEEDFDYLTFLLNGSSQPGAISGEIDWTRVTQQIPAGTHTVRWRYSKDSSAADGLDAGFLDQVQFAPDGPVVTGSATDITETGATLNGSVNPTGLVTTAYFEYGTTPSYGNTVPVTLSPNNGNGYQQVSAVLNGLQASTTYHFRLVAANSSNPAPGEGGTFITVSPYTYTISNGQATITGYNGTGTNLLIPSTINSLPVTAIGAYAFEYRSDITSVVIPSGVTAIGDQAFYNCSALASVTLPGTVNNFGDSVFSNCEALQNVTFGSGITGLGDFMFGYCRKLAAVTIPSGVTAIPDYAFYACSGLATINLPATVVSIGQSAFDGCEALTGLTLPGGLRNIGSGAFSECYSLSSISIPAGVTDLASSVFSDCYDLATVTFGGPLASIGSFAFSRCESMTGLTLPASLSTIGQSAFSGCKSLKSISIPSGVTTLPSGVLSYCTGLAGVTFAGQVTSIDSQAFSGCSMLATITLPSSLSYLGSYVFEGCGTLSAINIPAGITSIPSGTFQGCHSLASVTMSGPVTIIGAGAFNGCKSLSSLNLPATVTTIGGEAFRDCDGLATIALPAGLTSIEFYAFADCDNLSAMTLPSFVASLPAGAFSGCRRLSSMILPSALTSIGDYAFETCLSLKGLALPASLVSIGRYAFEDCESLSGIILPTGLTNLGPGAFGGCSALTSITIPAGINRIGYSTFADCTSLTSVTLPAGLASIGEEAFLECVSLTNLTLPATVTEIGDYAFEGCLSLTNVNIPDATGTLGWGAFLECSELQSINVGSANPNYASQYGVLYNKSMTALIQCPGGMSGSLDVPAGVTTIRDSAFSGCSKLTAVTLPGTVTTIQSGAFSGCSGLATLVIPGGVTRIESYSFSGCAKLSTITIPPTVTGIDSRAFFYCESLASVTLPAALGYIGEEAFRNCLALTGISIPAAVEEIGGGAFTLCRSMTSITVDPANAVYASSSGMLFSKDFAYLIKCPEAKSGSVVIPAGVDEIGESAFRYCHGITNVTIPSTVSTIADSAFRFCSGLVAISLPASVEEIGNHAFSGCSGLTSVNFPASVDAIGSHAFSYCYSLKKAVFFGDAPDLGEDVFHPAAAVFTVCHQLGKRGFGGITWKQGYPIRGFVSLTVPEIAVEKPGPVNLIDGGSAAAFAPTPVGSSSAMTFTVRNLGVADLTGIAVSTTGTNSSEFTVIANPAASVEGPLGATTFTIRFSPKSAGTRTAVVKISNNDADEGPFDIPVTGNATAPEISVLMSTELADGKSTVNFGTITINSTAVRTFTIKNVGTAPLTGLALTRVGSHASNYITVAPAATSLAPGASTTFKVTFKPSATGTRIATLRIASNDADESVFDVNLTGTGQSSKGTSRPSALALLSAPREYANTEMAASRVGMVVIKGVDLIDGRRYRTITVIDPRGLQPSPESVQVSPNLVDWSSGRNHTTVVRSNAGMIKVRDKAPLTGDSKRHIRWQPQGN